MDSFGTATPKMPIKGEISQYLGLLWRFGVVLSLDNHIAERLVEQTCIHALERDPLLICSQRMDYWLFSILHSIWFDKHRSNCGRNRHHDNNCERTADRGGDPYRSDSADLILHQVMALPDASRAAVFLTYVERMSYSEVAEVLTLPIGTIMSRLADARILLAESRGRAKESETGEVA
ncbi:sigma factor-like helix-turn-helix DNA-binding protein [Rhizobium leguminosarum]|uniref:sigma factor-like helix-turn-helix DNA-binding protein n=1 Tax=Rhizobium leguminosarum TaxID=384 RepID=UPI001C91E65F|nr:sigma factor-like helix-turn-helix DNA-binding protein [Rhizobium leguminosarum]MBY2919464.1 RNA polymerase sigma factor [Rhizobium leguminosarum]MBY2975071.1 RNA polymerase sigma factor [Rhizobium leguminosarum]MBY2981804.1 RNA polymerase sigma factor [Rhizobium leguminosarum]MBY3011019.1 RNA polymerase sigma factor [Rhizobium leguminosarum]